MHKYDIQFIQAINLALTIYNYDNSNSVLDAQSGPKWLDKMKQLINELSDIINSLSNNEYKSYLFEAQKNYPENKVLIIHNEWQNVRLNTFQRFIRQNVKRTQK